MRDNAYEDWAYTEGKWYHGNKDITNSDAGHGVMTNWVNAHFLNSYSKLSKDKKKEVLDLLWLSGSNQLENDCAAIVIY